MEFYKRSSNLKKRQNMENKNQDQIENKTQTADLNLTMLKMTWKANDLITSFKDKYWQNGLKNMKQLCFT